MSKRSGFGMTVGVLALALAVPFASAHADTAEQFPNKRIRLLMGQTPGGAPDILARILTDQVGKTLGQPVVVEYKPSAGGVLAMDALVKAPADGYTWLLGTPTMLAVIPQIRKKLPFDPYKDLLPLTSIGASANVLVVGPSLNVNSPKELVDYAKANPTKVKYASAGLGSTAHLAGELFAALTDTQLLHVPYKGAGQALGDVTGGVVDFMLTSPAAAKTYVQSGRLKVMATTGSSPDPILPDLPLLNETVKGYELVQWWGIVLRAGTDPAIAQKVQAAFAQALDNPRVKELFREQGVTPRPMSTADFNTFVKSERVRYQELIKRANVPMED